MAFYPAPGAGADASAAAAREAGGDEAGSGWQSALGALARRARAATALEQPPRVQELTAPLNSGPDQDLEQGEPRWAAWARQAAGSVRQQAAEAAEQAQRGLERARTVDWAEQVKSVQGNVSRSLDLAVDRAQTASATLQENFASGVERAKSVEWSEHAKGLQQNVSRSFEMVSTSASSAGASLQEKGQAAGQFAREMSGKLKDAEVLQKARDGASSAAGAARGALQAAGSRAQGLAALTMSPGKLARFLAVFLVGTLFVVMSFNFLPILLLAPQKFSMLFTIGSVTILSSFAVLNGPVAMLTSLAQREKLPFSITYAVGLLGTLWATLVMRSYVFTAVFAVVQALSLIYFVASFLPGGRSALSLFWRLGSAGARTVVQA